MDAPWGTVAELIHELGAIRAFVDEAETRPEVCGGPLVSNIRAAMKQATDAISHIFTDSQESVVKDAWGAVAQAQDTVAKARETIVAARAAAETAQTMRELTRAQQARPRAGAGRHGAGGTSVAPPGVAPPAGER